MSTIQSRIWLLWAVWLVSAVAGGLAFVRWFGGHASVVIFLYVIPLAVWGAIASSLGIGWEPLRRLGSAPRILSVASLSSLPIAVLSVYGMLSDSAYGALDALRFSASFGIPVLVLVFVTEWYVIRPALSGGEHARV